jgi:hypothetical protein
MKIIYSTKSYGHYLQSYSVDEVQQQGARFVASAMRYRKDGDRLVELERHVPNPEGFGDLDSAISAADASRLSYLQCAAEEHAGALEETWRHDLAYELAPYVEIDPFAETSGCNTRITYLYRGADNHKQHEEIVVAGVLTEQEQQEMRDTVASEGFIPEQVGISALRFERHPASGNPGWHELVEISITEDPTTFPGTARQLLLKFKHTDWDLSSSSHHVPDVPSFGGL